LRARRDAGVIFLAFWMSCRCGLGASEGIGAVGGVGLENIAAAATAYVLGVVGGGTGTCVSVFRYQLSL